MIASTIRSMATTILSAKRSDSVVLETGEMCSCKCVRSWDNYIIQSVSFVNLSFVNSLVILADAQRNAILWPCVELFIRYAVENAYLDDLYFDKQLFLSTFPWVI